MAERLGMKRVVIARELSKKDISGIVSGSNVEIEIFAHGAMCMSYSGQCLMSSMLGGRSGNRGRCAQPCRLPYSINGEKDTKFYLSLKDMSLLNHIAEIKDIGVTSLKLEGRMKGAAYVAAVVRTYRNCIDTGEKPTSEDLQLINQVFFRGGYSDGYFINKTGREMFAFDKPDNPYLNESKSVNKKLSNTYTNTENVRHKLRGSLSFKIGEYPVAEWKCGDISVKYTGRDIVQAAQQHPLTKDAIIAQLSKTGGTVFDIEALDIKLESGCFLTAKALNSLRRESLDRLEQEIVLSFKREVIESQPVLSFGALQPTENTVEYNCSVADMEQFNTVRQFPFVKIGVPLSVAAKNSQKLQQDIERIVLIPPAVLNGSEWEECIPELDKLYNLGFTRMYIHNLSMLSENLPFEKYGSFRLNVFNCKAAEFFLQNGCKSVTLSPELNLSQCKDIAVRYNAESIIYGRLPLMVTENCIARNRIECTCNGNNYVTDRMGISFPVVKDDNICRSIVLNSKPIYMADKKADLQHSGIYKRHLMFTVENKAECATVCSDYFSDCVSISVNDYTRAHFYKGV